MRSTLKSFACTTVSTNILGMGMIICRAVEVIIQVTFHYFFFSTIIQLSWSQIHHSYCEQEKSGNTFDKKMTMQWRHVTLNLPKNTSLMLSHMHFKHKQKQAQTGSGGCGDFIHPYTQSHGGFADGTSIWWKMTHLNWHHSTPWPLSWHICQ